MTMKRSRERSHWTILQLSARRILPDVVNRKRLASVAPIGVCLAAIQHTF